MDKRHWNTLLYIVWGIITIIVPHITMHAQKTTKGPIVIVSSYNPDVKSMRENILAFSNEYKEKGGRNEIEVVNMNCRNLPEAGEWKDRLDSMLKPYFDGKKKPAAFILLGAEASSAYFSLTDSIYKQTPVIIGQRGNAIVDMRTLSADTLKSWNPPCHDLSKDYKDYNIIGGEVFNYDIESNIQLAKHYFPERKTIVLLTDNTLGGVTMKAHALNQLRKHKEYKIETIDGRDITFVELTDILNNMKGDRLLLIGTWRIDRTDSYTLKYSTAALGKINHSIPAITLASVGIGDWAFGGNVPDYHVTGGELADMMLRYEKTGKPEEIKLLDKIPTFDYKIIKEFNFKRNDFPDDAQFVNEPESPLKEYEGTIITVIVILCALCIGLFTSLHFLRTSQKLGKELKENNKELQKAKEKADAANKMKSAFIANMSHEIRTPLNAVLGFTQIITDPTMNLSTEEKTEYGRYITTNAETLMNLVNDILDISKLDSDTMKFDKEDIDLVDLCNVAAESAKNGLKDGVEITTSLPVLSAISHTDKQRILQVLNNLLTNAKKFTSEGTINVALKILDDSDTIEISVSDTGTGIPADKAEAVFQRFNQLDGFKQGAGLGLAISRSFIEHLDGHIWLDTNYTDGARFVFTQPLKR